MKILGFSLDRKVEPELPTEFATRDRKDLLANYKAGNLTSVKFSADVFVEGPNKNHTLLNPSELKDFAASFVKQPFLADHAREQGKRGGTILASELIDRDGKRVIRQTIEAVKPWAVEGVLDGTIDRFSIGWAAEEYLCTACDTDILDCGHLWDIGKKLKNGKTVEILMRGLEGAETSAVTHPAVSGTGTGDVLAQLSQLAELRKKDASGNPAGAIYTEDEMLEKVLSLLGLPAGTTEPEAHAALEARLTAPTALGRITAALGFPSDKAVNDDELIAKVVGLTAPGNVIPKAEHDRVLDELGTMKASEKVRGAKAAGKITPAMEAWALEFAKKDPASFEAFISHAPVQIPVGLTMPTVPTVEQKLDQLSEQEEHVITRMGVKREDYLAERRAETAARAN